jgi:hypothetical protein
MNTGQKWAIGGLLAASFCIGASWPVDRRVEGKIVGMQLEYSPDGASCHMDQVQLASGSISEKVTLDTRKLDIPCPALRQHVSAEVKTNRAHIFWDRANSHHGLPTVKFEITP